MSQEKELLASINAVSREVDRIYRISGRAKGKKRKDLLRAAKILAQAYEDLYIIYEIY